MWEVIKIGSIVLNSFFLILFLIGLFKGVFKYIQLRKKIHFTPEGEEEFSSK